MPVWIHRLASLCRSMGQNFISMRAGVKRGRAQESAYGRWCVRSIGPTAMIY